MKSYVRKCDDMTKQKFIEQIELQYKEAGVFDLLNYGEDDEIFTPSLDVKKCIQYLPRFSLSDKRV